MKVLETEGNDFFFWYSQNERMMTQHVLKLDIDPMNSRHGASETFFGLSLWF